jgi:hypothetical protein
MTAILAIDPGTTRSAWVNLNAAGIQEHGIAPNENVADIIRLASVADMSIVIEDIEPRQQPLGREVADTLRWIGRFIETAGDYELITRRTVTNHLIDGGTKSADSRIRAALIDRFGGKDAIRKGGPLYGIHGDEWAALAVAVTWADLHPEVADAA